MARRRVDMLSMHTAALGPLKELIDAANTILPYRDRFHPDPA
jgi:hypothetical protein